MAAGGTQTWKSLSYKEVTLQYSESSVTVSQRDAHTHIHTHPTDTHSSWFHGSDGGAGLV